MGTTDWAARSAACYTPQQIQGAARWREHVAKAAVRPEPVPVDPSKLNPGQAFIYRVVADHNRRLVEGQTQPFRAIVAGTAGSGKTTRVAATQTYQSLPIMPATLDWYDVTFR